MKLATALVALGAAVVLETIGLIIIRRILAIEV